MADPPPTQQLAPRRDGGKAPARTRHQIRVACGSCRQRKVGCDGQRPCGNCRASKRTCNYDTEGEETRQQATKRKYEELEQEHTALLEVVSIAALRLDGPEILLELKQGRNVKELLVLLKEGDFTYQTHLGSRPGTRHMLLSLLVQSTASLEEIIVTAPRIADARLNSSWTSGAESQTLKNRTINITALTSIVEGTVPSRSSAEVGTSALPATQLLEDSSRPDTALFSVPAKPWTRLTTDDRFASHLVTVFLNYHNVYWRYVEEDIFLASMRAGDLKSQYCSPFLVNAMFAMACMSSEHHGAFYQPDELMTRGQHFHDEALRLWLLEDGRASLTNLQALVVMSMECGFRGKDKLGSTLLSIGMQMNADLPFPSPSSSDDMTMTDEQRCRICASWSAHLFDATTSLGLLRPSTPIDSRLQFLPNIPESLRLWDGEPFVHIDQHFRSSALMRERCQLVRLTYEVTELLFSPRSNPLAPDFQQLGRQLMSRLEQWQELLPVDLQYHKTLPAPVYELHGHYHCAVMTLHMFIKGVDLPQIGPEAPANTSGLQRATLRAVRLLRHFRKTYGFKSSPAFMFQSAAIASSVLLKHLESAPVQDLEAEQGKQDQRQSIESAFGESYRCLLAIGTRVMIGRGVARMVFHTSRQTHISLPSSIQRLLDIFREVVWTSTDIHYISSSFPNFCMAKTTTDTDDARMEGLLKQWEVTNF